MERKEISQNMYVYIIGLMVSWESGSIKSINVADPFFTIVNLQSGNLQLPLDEFSM